MSTWSSWLAGAGQLPAASTGQDSLQVLTGTARDQLDKDHPHNVADRARVTGVAMRA
jgi:hypothetical protein